MATVSVPFSSSSGEELGTGILQSEDGRMCVWLGPYGSPSSEMAQLMSEHGHAEGVDQTWDELLATSASTSPSQSTITFLEPIAIADLVTSSLKRLLKNSTALVSPQ